MAKCAHTHVYTHTDTRVHTQTHVYTHTDTRVHTHRHTPAGEGPGNMPWGEEEEEKNEIQTVFSPPKTYNFV